LKHILQTLGIALLTILFVGLFLWKSNLSDVWRMIKSVNVLWLVVGLLVNFSALIFRTQRWRVILDETPAPRFYPTFFANTVGFMFASIFPAGGTTSTVARPALLARRTSVSFSHALGTGITERVLDLFSILILFVYFGIRRWREFSTNPVTSQAFYIVKAGVVGAAVTLVVLSIFITGLFFFRGAIRRMHAFLGRIVPARFRDSWMRFFDSFAGSLDLVRRPAPLAKVILLTALIWLALQSQFWFVVKAMHHPLPFDASFFVSGVTTIGLAIPTPGGVGGFHKACQIVLTKFYGFDIDSSVAVALLFHAVGTVPVLVSGLLLFLREGLRWKDVAVVEAGDIPKSDQ
jgi:glycosyltransferase 2 family protein